LFELVTSSKSELEVSLRD